MTQETEICEGDVVQADLVFEVCIFGLTIGSSTKTFRRDEDLIGVGSLDSQSSTSSAHMYERVNAVFR